MMVHPTATYRRLASNVSDGGTCVLIRRPLFVAFVFGSFVSLTVSGRLTLSLIFDGMIFWGFIPLLQALLVMDGRTVVYDVDGNTYGRPELVQLLRENPIPQNADDYAYCGSSSIDVITRVCGWLGLLGLLFFGRKKQSRS